MGAVWLLATATLLFLSSDAGAAPRDAPKSSDRTLHIRSIPAVEGVSSNVYEVYMQPYPFEIRPIRAMVSLRSMDAEEGKAVMGMLMMTQPHPPSGPVIVKGNITGLSPGKHGLHVHLWGTSEGGCASTGPHFNPFLARHGGPNDPVRHIGDLGNVRAGDDGVAAVDLLDGLISLTGPRSIAGRSLVVHADEDDLGRGATKESATMGSAGEPMACGVIGFVPWDMKNP